MKNQMLTRRAAAIVIATAALTLAPGTASAATRTMTLDSTRQLTLDSTRQLTLDSPRRMTLDLPRDIPLDSPRRMSLDELIKAWLATWQR